MHQGASWRGAAGCEGAFPRELAQAPAKVIGKFCILDSESREPSRALSLERQWHLCPLPFPAVRDKMPHSLCSAMTSGSFWECPPPPHAGPGLRWAGLGLAVTFQPRSGQL